MESPESYLPPTSSLDEIYPLDESLFDSRSPLDDQKIIDALILLAELKPRSRLYNPIVGPDKPPSFFLLKRRPGRRIAVLEGWETGHGEWSQKNSLAIPNTFQANSPDSPRFMGTKTALEFIPRNAKKAVLGMTQYNVLRPSENGDGLYLNEEVSLCHVFPLKPKKRHRSGCAADQCNNAVLPPLDERRQQLSNFDMTKDNPVNVYDIPIVVPRKPWDNFTEIYTEDPKLMYAACNQCNTMLKLTGGKGCGTKSLTNHSEALKCKRKQQQPGNTSLTPTPSIVLDGHHGITTDGVVEITGISI